MSALKKLLNCSKTIQEAVLWDVVQASNPIVLVDRCHLEKRRQSKSELDCLTILWQLQRRIQIS